MMELENDARFANILDECCGRVQRGETLERCLADYPAEYRDELRRLAGERPDPTALLEHAVDGRRAGGHHVLIEHHEGHAPVALQRVLPNFCDMKKRNSQIKKREFEAD